MAITNDPTYLPWAQQQSMFPAFTPPGYTSETMFDYTDTINNMGKSATGGGLTDLVGQLGGMNPLVSTALGVGGKMLAGLGGLFKKESWGDRKAKELWGMAQNRIGQSVLHPDQYLADYMRMLAPQFTQEAETLAENAGLDSAVALGKLQQMKYMAAANQLLPMKEKSDMLTSERDLGLMQLMSSLSNRG